jgi:hypothetical protein
VAFVRPDEVPVVLVKFAAKYKGGEIRLEKEAFDNSPGSTRLKSKIMTAFWNSGRN